MQIERQEIRVFAAVVEEGGFGRAAETLDVSQSAVSQAIANLEHKVNTALLIRGRKLELTVPEGHVVVLGDNRMRAKDSVDFGALPADQLLGRVFQVRYSVDTQNKSLRSERKGIDIP